ncbi:MAG: UMP kinase [Nitrososphaerota archaeon]|nr:UMP kinase [Candidatus Calditenuaceae archaeon]MDW8072970.1 UMP kinase [Nitrososphaerota archaeon]
MRLVIKIGGHLFSSEGGVSVEWIRRATEAISGSHTVDDKLVIVVGGGLGARAFIEAARKLGADETMCDEIAILVTRIHASLFIKALGEKAYPLVVRNVDELKAALVSRGLAVAGGFWPGQSTFAVAAYCAESIGADRLITVTNVEGLYDKDPRLHRDARIIPRISHSELRKLLAGSPQLAGEYRLIDNVGLSILERSKIKLYIIDGRDAENIRRAILEGYAGTIVEA